MRKRIDWKKGRRLYERDGKSFSEIGEILRCDRRTVSTHAKAEGWLNATDVARATAPARREEIFRRFIERDAETIHENLAKKHQLTSGLLELALGHLDRLREGHRLLIEQGDSVVAEDPIMAIRRLALVAKNVEVVDRSLAGLKGDDWRSGSAAGGADSEADEAAVLAALEDAEAGEPTRG